MKLLTGILLPLMLLGALEVCAQVRVPPCGYWCFHRPVPRRVLPERPEVPVPAVDPSIDYQLPRTVGVAQIAYSEAWQGYQRAMPHHFTTGELFDELAGHGIRSVRLWLTVPYWDGIEAPGYNPTRNYNPIFEDMAEVWGHPDVDIIVVIFTGVEHALIEPGCQSGTNMSWTLEDTARIAHFFFQHFPDQDKTIVIANPETDNQWRGFDCVEPDEIDFDSFWGPARQQECFDSKTLEECVYEMAMIRYDYAIRRVEERQKIVQEVRDMYPEATLRLRTSMTISQTVPNDKYFGHYALERVHEMEFQPDYIGLSYWRNHGRTIQEAVDHIYELTGYPPERIFLDQAGQNEKKFGRQYPVFMKRALDAWDSGIDLVLFWMWRQTWHAYGGTEDDKGLSKLFGPLPIINNMSKGLWPANKGVWEWLTTEGDVVWGSPNSGLEAIYQLNDEVR